MIAYNDHYNAGQGIGAIPSQEAVSILNVHYVPRLTEVLAEYGTGKALSFDETRWIAQPRYPQYANTMKPVSGRVNESNDLGMLRTDSPRDRLLVRQISGAIARRIVCRAAPGRDLAGGEKFGMIKFGSRTELYLPCRENAKCLVRIGDKVKAGVSPLIRYE